MTTEFATADATLVAEPVITETDGDLFLAARCPAQMDQCQEAMKVWAAGKVAAIEGEIADLQENIEIAVVSNWNPDAMVRAERGARKRLAFYQKIKAALDAGYYIVPNFPVDVIAIRTKRSEPDPKSSRSRWDGRGVSAQQQDAQLLPAGNGDMQNPQPVVLDRVIGKNEQQQTIRTFWAKSYQDIEFPFATAKPHILQATSDAMRSRIFDEIGVLPGKRKREDPVIVGRIIDPRSTKWNRVEVTFLIAWFLDTKVL